MEIRETPLLPIELHKSWLDLDNKLISYQYDARFLTFVFDQVGFDLAKECRQKSADQVWAKFSDDQYFEKPLLRHLPEIARNLIALDEQSAALKNAAIFNTTGERENGGKLIRNVIENLVKRERLEQAAIPYSQRQSQFGKQSPQSGLNLFMSELIKRNGNITVTQMLAKIVASQGVGYIVEVTAEDEIYYKNPDGSTHNSDGTRLSAEITGLSSRLSRLKAKKRIALTG